MLPVLPALPKVAGRAKSGKPRWEVADIFRVYGHSYRQNHPLPLVHLKVMHAIEVCRTASLGGHVERCDTCGFERNAYNSCRNRHCPKCQTLSKAEWLEKRKAELLPVTYFHTVFTLPHEINPIALCNRKEVYDILFKAVAETLMQFGADPKHGLGGKIGFTAILHTWDQRLRDHIHLHCLIPAGALSFDGSGWIHARKNFLFPVRALSKAFRGKFIDFFKRSFSNGELLFPGAVAQYGKKEGFAKLIDKLWEKDWVVYSKASFDGPESVLDYLGRYTHRVAIANHRIDNVEDGSVTFWYRDRADCNKRKRITVGADEFIRRFLLHVLPNSYMRIRHFGFLANRSKKQDLPLCRKSLGLSPSIVKLCKRTMQEVMLQLTGIDVLECPCCRKGRLRNAGELPKIMTGEWIFDSS